MEFRGTFEHTLDDRGRVALPARYRHAFADGAVLTINPEGSIEVYTPDGFSEMSNHVAALPATTPEGRRARRRFDARSFDTELDRQGRILVPSRFRELAGLRGPVVIVGRRECLEIWDPEGWDRELAAADADGSSPAQESEG